MKTYKITELCGYAWECAIRNTINKINIAGAKHGTCYTFKDDSRLIEEIAEILKLTYDVDGNLVRA